MVVQSGSRLMYVVHNLSLGKTEQSSQFPTDATSFLGTRRAPVTLHTTAEVRGAPSTSLSPSFSDFFPLEKNHNVDV